MFRSISNKLIAVYLLPFRITPRLFYYVKGVFFTSGVEHLYLATRYIKRHWRVPIDSIIIDVGGFNGETSLYFASEFKDQIVYCVEPNARLWPILDKLAAAHNRIRIKHLALGRSKGEAVLHVTVNNVSSSLNEISAQDLGRTPPAFQASLKQEAEARVEVS